MAITYIVYETTGSTADFAFSFPYISTSHVKVSVDGADLSTDDYTVVESPSVKVTCSPAIDSGQYVKVYRKTPGREEGAVDLLVDFQDGSVLSEADLDAVCQQLLYLSQEAEENATASLSLDYDGDWAAREKRIKELSGTVSGDRDAATKEYVDGKTLYAGAVSLPQMWAKVGSDFSGTTGDCTVTLADPAPSGDNDNLYVVAFNGDTQTPTTDFTISGSTFTLKMDTVTLLPADKVTIINFGVSRQYIKQPITGDVVGDVSLTVKEITDQTADLQQWQDTAGAALAKVAVDGDATFVDINATGNADVDGNLNVDGSLTVDTTSTLTGDSTVGGTLGVTGATTLSDTLGVTGATTLSSGASVSGDMNLLTGALQYAGVEAMSIRQMVSATWADTTHNVTETWDTKENTAFMVFGGKVTIAPKSASSKILLIASFLVRDDDDTNDVTSSKVGSYGYISKDNTQAVGVEHDGTLLDRRLLSYHRINVPTTGINHVDCYTAIPHFDLLDAENTDSRTYDYVLSKAETNQRQTTCWADSEHSFFVAIEIG